MSAWNDFFGAGAGAAATLAGLLFVAVSINLSRILSHPHLPGRAGEALIVILTALATCIFGLVPGQGLRVLGAELLGCGLLALLVVAGIQFRSRKNRHPDDRVVVRTFTGLIPPSLFAVAGAILLGGRGCGLYWLAPATLLSFVGGVFNAWVLLVEILR